MIQKREVEYSKELDDVMVLLIGVVKDIKSGKSAGEIASGVVPNLVSALAGVDQIDDEAKENRKVFIQTVGYRAGDILDAVLGV